MVEKSTSPGAHGLRSRSDVRNSGASVLEDDPLLAEMVRRLVSAYQPEEVYLFGSRARGEARPDSDYDLLVVVPESASPEQRDSRLAYEALLGMGVAKDVVVVTRDYYRWMLGAAASLPATVEREGHLLYAG